MNEGTRLSLPIPAVELVAPPRDGVITALTRAEPAGLRVETETASTALAGVARANTDAALVGSVALDRVRATRACSQALSLSLMSAGWWIATLSQYLTLYDFAFRAPHVTANAEDEIVLEWWRAERKLTFYVNGASIEFVQAWGANIVTEMNDGTVTSGTHAAILWRWLMSSER